MFVSTGSTSSDDQHLGGYSPPTSPAHREEVQSAEIHPGAEAQNLREVPAVIYEILIKCLRCKLE